MEAFAQFGSDLDASTQKLLGRGARLTQLLKQPQFHPMPFEEQSASIFAGTNGYLDAAAVGDVSRYEAAMLAYQRREHQAHLTAIRDHKDLGSPATNGLDAALGARAKIY